MKLKGKFKNLKTGAKRVFVGMLILCILSSATGIGSIFVQATEEGDLPEQHTAAAEWSYDDNNHWHVCTVEGCEEKHNDEAHSYTDESYTYTANNNGTHNVVAKCEVCGASVDKGSAACEYVDGVCTYCGASEVVEPNNTDDPESIDGEKTTEDPEVKEPAETGDGHHWTETWVYSKELGMHYKACTDAGCEEIKTEVCTYEWVSDADGHKYACSVCGHEDTDKAGTHVFEDENGNILDVCSICGYPNPDAVKNYRLMKSDYTLLGGSSAGNVTATSTYSVEYSDPYYLNVLSYEELWTTMPEIASGLKYTGGSLEFFSNRGEIKSEIIKNYIYYEMTVSYQNPSDSTPGTYKPQVVVKVHSEAGSAYMNNFTITATYTATIELATLSDVFELKGEEDYLKNTGNRGSYFTMESKQGYESATRDAVELVIDDTIGDTPEAGQYATYTLKPKEDNGYYVGDEITKTVKVNDVALKFNGDSTLKDHYYGSLKVSPEDSDYFINTNNTSGYSNDGITFTYESDDIITQTIYIKYKKSNTEGHFFTKTITFQILPISRIRFEDFFSTQPKFKVSAVYDGENAAGLLETKPVFDDDLIKSLNLYGSPEVEYSVDDGFTRHEWKTEDPQGTKRATYSIFARVKYKDSGDSDPYYAYPNNKESYSYTTLVYHDMNSKAVKYIPVTDIAEDYQSFYEGDNLKTFYTLENIDGKKMEAGTDYTVAISPVGEIPTTGTNVTLSYIGYENKYYTGTKNIDIPVSKIDVLFNGEAQKEEYSDGVVITAPGYVMSDADDGNFTDSIEINYACSNETFPLYFKKVIDRENGLYGNIVTQDVEHLNIKDGSNIAILYDGEKLKNLYYDKVEISAVGYTVSKKEYDSVYESSFTLRYDDIMKEDQDATTTPVATFPLYFKNKTTGKVYKKQISGINLIKSPYNMDIYYNGKALLEWYNDSVIITAKTKDETPKDMYISDSEDGSRTSKYTISNSGKNSIPLWFWENTDDSEDLKPYTVFVNIDRTAPTGTITVNGTSSNKFTVTEKPVAYVNKANAASISAADDLSGVDTIKYYVSNTIYTSKSDLIAEMKDNNKSWRTYSSESKPALVKDKDNYIYGLITDKAGNSSYVAMGSVMYDTVAPTVTTATVTDSADGKSKVLVIAGTDELSGINRFKLMYFEKDNTHQPSKDEIFNMGTYITAAASSGKEAGATYTIEGLESGKTYMFYVASVDRAGNISDVKAIEGEGTTAADAAAAKAAADAEAAASSALAAAPNGLAGGNSGQPTTSPEASAGSQSGTSGEEEGEEERVISRDPYIAEATGSTQIGPINTSGWDKIKGEIRKADNGTQMSVEMSGVSEIPLSVLKEVADRDDLEVTFLINDGVEWTIKGSSITEEGIKTVDLGVKMGSKNIPAKVSNDVVGSYQHVDFAVNEEGELGFTATISVPVGTSNAGMNATLYYYNPEKNELEAVKASIVDDSGRASFDMTHCSDYTIVITPEKLLSDSEVSYSVTRSDTLTSEEIFDGTKIRLADLFGVSGGGRIWLFVIAAISAALCVAILYFPGLQKEEGN